MLRAMPYVLKTSERKIAFIILDMYIYTHIVYIHIYYNREHRCYTRIRIFVEINFVHYSKAYIEV